MKKPAQRRAEPALNRNDATNRRSCMVLGKKPAARIDAEASRRAHRRTRLEAKQPRPETDYLVGQTS